ncbi:MAG TPA: hypothetical protein EYQ80_03010 [Candidatus Poseidoniales archaeon]|nr:hypothetical protein [Candidatus Poseidoniales archaeon]
MTGAARYLCTRLKEAGHEVLFAGGYVRDCLLGLPSKDIDIATSATPEEVEKLFPKSIPVGAAFGVLIVVHEGFHFEVATFRDDGNYADGRRPTNVTFVDAEQDALASQSIAVPLDIDVSGHVSPSTPRLHQSIHGRNREERTISLG